MPDGGYSVVPGTLREHIGTVRQLATDLRTLADPIAGLYPPGGPSWTGTEGGAAMLRKCLNEIAEVLRVTSTGVIGYADGATECLRGYDRVDRGGAEKLRACLSDLRARP